MSLTAEERRLVAIESAVRRLAIALHALAETSGRSELYQAILAGLEEGLEGNVVPLRRPTSDDEREIRRLVTLLLTPTSS